MTIELKTCPFCRDELHSEEGGFQHRYSDTCPLDRLYIEDRHVTAWNDRADAQAALTAIERAAYERGVRNALTEAVKEAKGSVTIGGQRFLTVKLDDLEPAILALLTQEGR